MMLTLLVPNRGTVPLKVTVMALHMLRGQLLLQLLKELLLLLRNPVASPVARNRGTAPLTE